MENFKNNIFGFYENEEQTGYNRMGIPYLNQSREELDEEIAGFAKLKEKKAI